jgi:translation initiation factor 2B subunit (eIF-2B alpha/beta/delta family)
MKNIPAKLNFILNNKTLGSSELALLLNDYFLSIRNNRHLINKSIKLIKSSLGHFEVINSYLKEFKFLLNHNDNKVLLKFLREYSQNEEHKAQCIFKKLYPEVKKFTSVITLSRSKTVIEILKFWHKKNKKIKVVVCESRPKLEGRLTASELAKAGINVELITDAMVGIYVPAVNAAIIGADSILKNGNIINKVGSKALALLCNENNKPIYAVATRSKFTDKNKFKFKKENPNEVWRVNAKNIRINNVYFEEVEKEYITKVFTD